MYPSGRTPPPFIRAPSVWCPFFRRGAQRAPAHLFLCRDVPPVPRPFPFCTAPSVWCPFFRRGAQCAPAYSRRSHPAGADMIRPMFPCLIPRGNRYHSPAGVFFCVRFPGDSAGRSGTGPYGKGGKLERRAAHSRPYAATLVKCSHNRPLIGCTPQERPHPPPFCTAHRFGAPSFVGAHSVRPRIPAAVTPQGRI